MRKYRILLNSIDKVKSFIKMINSYNIHADILCDSYAVDAQSILGIFALNLTKELKLIIHSIYPEKDLEELESELQPYIVS